MTGPDTYEELRRDHFDSFNAKWGSQLADPVAGPERLRVVKEGIVADVTASHSGSEAHQENARVYGGTTGTLTYTPDSYDKYAQVFADNRAKAKAAGAHRCKDCNADFGEAAALLLHYTRQSHLDKIAGIDAAPPFKSAMKVKAQRQQVVIDGTSRCVPCNKNFGQADMLRDHKTRGLHQRRQAKWDEDQKDMMEDES